MSSYILKPNSIDGEYYCGDLPGNLQYRKDSAELIAMDTTALSEGDFDKEWSHDVCSAENKNRLLPHTQNPQRWDLRMVMKRTTSEGRVWLKGVLINKQNGEVALMTACDSKDAVEKGWNVPGVKHRSIQSNDKEWFVGHYRMGGPLIFWRSLQGVLRQIQ